MMGSCSWPDGSWLHLVPQKVMRLQRAFCCAEGSKFEKSEPQCGEQDDHAPCSQHHKSFCPDHTDCEWSKVVHWFASNLVSPQSLKIRREHSAHVLRLPINHTVGLTCGCLGLGGDLQDHWFLK